MFKINYGRYMALRRRDGKPVFEGILSNDINNTRTTSRHPRLRAVVCFLSRMFRPVLGPRTKLWRRINVGQQQQHHHQQHQQRQQHAPCSRTPQYQATIFAPIQLTLLLELGQRILCLVRAYRCLSAHQVPLQHAPVKSNQSINSTSKSH